MLAKLFLFEAIYFVSSFHTCPAVDYIYCGETRHNRMPLPSGLEKRTDINNLQLIIHNLKNAFTSNNTI